MRFDFSDDKVDGLVCYQSILYSQSDPSIVGNGFINLQVAIFVMYNSKGDFIDAVVEKVVKK